MRFWIVALFCLIGLGGIAQPQTLTDVNGLYTIGSSTLGGTSDAVVIGLFNDPAARYADTDVQVGDVIFDGACNRWEIMVINSVGGGIMNLDVRDINATGIAPAFGQGVIIRETTNFNYPLFVSENSTNISATLQACMETHLSILLDQTVGQGGAVACDTITQAAHGFSVLDMVDYDGANYGVASSTGPSEFPVGIVTEVIDVNTFVICNEGWLDITHGLTANQDYFLQDGGGYATSPDAEYNIFGFRTFGTDKVYFDVPESVAIFGAGSLSIQTITDGSTIDFTFSGNDLTAEITGSQSATDGQVLVSDGAGGVTFEDPNFLSGCFDVTQATHGFSVMDMVSHDGLNYTAANTAASGSLPVGFVTEVADANNFTICMEGRLTVTHGQTVNQDYFLQDGGGYGTTPDTDFSVFGFRTLDANTIYFDVPEYVFSGGGGGGGGGESTTVTDGNSIDFTLTGTDITAEITGINTANSGDVFVADGAGGGSWQVAPTAANIYTTDGQIVADASNTRNVDLNGQKVYFEGATGSVGINTARDAGMFSIKKPIATDSLVFKFDFGLGGDYSLMLDGPVVQDKTIFSAVGTQLAIGSNFTELRLQNTIALDNSNTRALTIDPVTDIIELVDLPGAATVIASNGLNDADPSANVDVELGGTLTSNTQILGANSFSFQVLNVTDIFLVSDGTAAMAGTTSTTLGGTNPNTIISANTVDGSLGLVDISADLIDINAVSEYKMRAPTLGEVRVAGNAVTDSLALSAAKSNTTFYPEISLGVNRLDHSVYTTPNKLATRIRQEVRAISLFGVQAFADDAAAGAGGLIQGDVYQTSGAGAAPLNVAGILMIKQ